MRSLALIKLWFIKALEYRTELLVWIAITLFNTLILISIWLSIFRGSIEIRGLQMTQVIQYFLLATIINSITASHFESWRSREIREGKIDHYLTKPIAYPLQIFFADIGNRLFYMCLIVPLTLLMYLGCMYFFKINLPTVSLGSFFLFLFFLGAGYMIEFSLAMIAVLLSFWFEGAEGLEHFKWITITLLSGYMIPLPLMPSWLQHVVNALPLKYMYAVPIGILQSHQSIQLFDVAYLGGFLMFLYLFQKWLWGKAVKKYSSAGG